MSVIFISYREGDAKAWALVLRDELARAFGDERVFLDVDALQAGNRRSQVEAALARSKVALVVIGPRWLIDGERPTDAAGDTHRQEVAQVLSTAGLTVIPVRVEGAATARPTVSTPPARWWGMPIPPATPHNMPSCIRAGRCAT